MRILIVEDDPLIALDLQAIAEAEGHEVAALCNSLAAVAGVRGQVDFALLDVDVADGDTFALASRLAADGIGFAFISASYRGDLPPELDGSAFVGKPYTPAEIARLLAQPGTPRLPPDQAAPRLLA